MNMKNLKNILKKRKALVISILFHLVVITALIIFLSFFKGNKNKIEKIQEIELFTPPKQNIEKVEIPPQCEPAKKNEVVKDEPITEHRKDIKRKRPAPEPFKTRLKDNVIKQWDTIEKKNLRNQ